MKKVILLFCAAVFTLISCSKTPDQKTILLYVRASEMYAQGKFTEAIENLDKEKKFPPSLLLRAKAEFFSGDLEKDE